MLSVSTIMGLLNNSRDMYLTNREEALGEAARKRSGAKEDKKKIANALFDSGVGCIMD
jgi:hypothetical protein